VERVANLWQHNCKTESQDKVLRKVYVFSHYLHPDDVVSSVLFSELCTGLARRGWDVTAFPCNRGCHDHSAAFPPRSEFEGVKIERIWRPAWRQSSAIGRILNAIWMISRWSLLAMRKRHCPDAIIIGTDPVFSVLVAIVWRFFKPKTILANWCFDLYPEAAFAEGLLNRQSMLARFMHVVLKRAYRACDLVVDLGPCMRGLLLRYNPALRVETIVPWALEESAHPLPISTSEHTALFNDCRLGLLYSGSFGRAHSYEPILNLVRLLKADDVCLTFSVRGNRQEELLAAILPDDSNIRFVPFTTAEYLSVRLSSADVHVVTLREEWTGAVVPSKFFGALAIGRPVLFCGNRSSAVAQWIAQFDLGWVLDQENIEEVAASIRDLLHFPSAIRKKGEHCHRVYWQQFSRDRALDSWHKQLTELLSAAEQGPEPLT
jgi:colanic acid biosynthesis glycosyl transferase WcaI